MVEKKQQILEAAKNLFNKHGYSKTSIDEISQAVNMRKSSLYYYFKNKEDLYMSSFKNEWKNQFNNFRHEANKASDIIEKIMRYITQSLDYYEKVILLHKIPIEAFINTRNLFRSLVDEINKSSIQFYSQCINEGQNLGVFKACDVLHVAHTISLVKFSIQYDQLSRFIDRVPSVDDWKGIRDNILNAIKLILEGIKN